MTNLKDLNGNGEDQAGERCYNHCPSAKKQNLLI